ncbi:hypothetical protein ACKA0G_10040 [Priestia megaterium]|uniref:hypothetical protein n=1 Tax=Priestia megaterium TaxID=1404 RepID=UPI0038A9F002
MEDYELSLSETNREFKLKLAEYQEIAIIADDLIDTKEFNVEYYSDNLKLLRSHEDKLIYLYDNEDDTVAQVELEDLKIILSNAASRIVTQRRQAIELEKFLLD